MSTTTAPPPRRTHTTRRRAARRARRLAGILRRPGGRRAVAAVLIFVFFSSHHRAPSRSRRGASTWIFTASSIVGIMAVAVALLMIGGEFDLSAGVDDRHHRPRHRRHDDRVRT